MMSCSDSTIEQNGARPSYWRIVVELVAAAGEDLVRVGLVADVPEDLVARASRAAMCSATASSQVPRLAPKWPPISPTVSMM